MPDQSSSEEIFLSSIKNQLSERKSKLEDAVKFLPDSRNLSQLIKEVDYALERIDKGTYGICEVCKDPIEADRLLADPLLTVCIDHLSEQQQRALELDLEYAGRIQRALLPKKEFESNNWDFAYNYQPTGTVSGDFCDLIQSTDGSLIFLIGDVSGKGVSASLMMSHLHALIHSLLSFNLPINEILQRANRLFCESTLSTNYATMVVGKAFPDGMLNICVAGHNPPFIYKNGKVVQIDATGIPVGMFCESEYSVEEFILEKGDTLLLYTDGLTEATMNGIDYGEERVKKQLAVVSGISAKEMVNNILFEHKLFLKNKKAEDDVTIAVLKKL
jgi:sigma-B regulation protein RsbU (phosphoserine phosphatase)